MYSLFGKVPACKNKYGRLAKTTSKQTLDRPDQTGVVWVVVGWVDASASMCRHWVSNIPTLSLIHSVLVCLIEKAPPTTTQ